MTRLELATDIENISNVKDQRVLVNRSIQHALERAYQFHDFPYYIQDKGVISTVATYETGTCSVTNSSTALTFLGSTLTSAMAGRKIRFNNEMPYYRILSVNTGAGTAVLEHAYQGSDNTVATFTIYKDEYRLAEDVDRYKIIRQLQNSVVLFDSSPTDFDQLYPMPQSYADPIRSIMVGTKLDTYTTGALSASVSTSILTGSSTSWTGVEGLGRLSKIRVGNNVYTVKSVDSDTQITIYETLSSAIAASTSYEITLNNIVVQLYGIPDSSRLLYYRYFRRPAILANDYDIPDMPHDWHYVLMYGALSDILAQKGDINKAENWAEVKFVNHLNLMKLKIGSFAPDRIYYRRSMDRVKGNLNGREKSSFDSRYSM